MKLLGLRLSTRITISALIIVVVCSAALVFIENARIRETYISDLRTHLKSDLETERLRLSQAVETLRQDVIFLSNAPPVPGIVRAALNRGYDPRYGNTHKVWVERLEQIFSAFSHAHPNYYRIRYIGIAEGARDLAGVGNSNKMFEMTSSDMLQTKADLDYFKATLDLQKSQIRLSEIYFEQERWGTKLTTRAVLRASTPVYTPSGDIFGMVVINMDMNSLLNFTARDLPAGVQSYLADMTGQYLLHPAALNILASGVAGRGEITTDFPFVKSALNLESPDFVPLQVFKTRLGNALASAMRIHFDPSDQSRLMLLLYSIPIDVANKQTSTIPFQNIAAGIIAMLLISGIAMLVLRRTFAPLEQIAYAADQISTGKHDVRLPQSGNGEIGSLSRALNTMLTQLSQREKSLQESEAKYRRLHESMMDAYVMTDMSGRFLESNRAYQEMLGYSAEELTHLTYVDLTPEKWHEFEARILNEQIIPYGQSQVYEKEYIRKNGTVFPLELRTSLLRNNDGQPDAMWAIVRDITERKRTENTLRLHSKILSNLVEGVFLIRASDGVIVYTNPQFERMFGYGPDELVGKHVSIVNASSEVPPEAVANTILARLEQTGIWNGEVLNIRKDGTTFWCHATVSGFKHPQFGQVWISAHEDITERKRAEEELQRFFNLIPDMACIATTEGHFLKINSAWHTVLGFSEQELLAIPFFDLIHPDDRMATIKEVERQVGGEATVHFTNRYRCKDGSYRWLEWQTTPAVNNTLYATARDITERKQTEEQLQKSADEIADLYNHAPCGYHSLDKDSVIRQINDTELAWLGYTRNEIIGKMKWPDLLTPASQQIFLENFPKFIKHGTTRDVAIEIVRKNGTTFTGLINSSAIYDSSGNFVMSRSTVSDITERRQAEHRLHELSAHIQTIREEEKSRIAREIHDDLGGTLTALKMDTYWLAKKLPADKATAPFLNRINSMSQLLDSAVGVTRRIITDLRPAIIDDLGLFAALEWQATQFHKRTGISCRVNCVEDTKKLNKEQSIALFRIFQESLTNVARHSGATRVEVEFQCDDDMVVLSISDNGRGLPEEYTAATNSYGHRGMSERAAQLGGQIKFETPPGGGFSVTVMLPLLDMDKKKEAS